MHDNTVGRSSTSDKDQLYIFVLWTALPITFRDQMANRKYIFCVRFYYLRYFGYPANDYLIFRRASVIIITRVYEGLATISQSIINHRTRFGAFYFV